ncbi:hypothetical protein FOMG_19416 [Fusarium oxysporum f. sp. melonis 26406]|uniref:Uncharacterized protein n=1 Tax=Fusarium oxysporum f. sp. melonis 26406 TaxID=1089452 RepID=W9Z6D2_FUSOX|nr:hypothetical protein FOMG_19416 [Fusarium oxysporum f. sp. melonis 26406]
MPRSNRGSIQLVTHVPGRCAGALGHGVAAPRH